MSVLPEGFLTLHIGGAPYYYWGGIYYQPSEGGYVDLPASGRLSAATARKFNLIYAGEA